MKFICKIFGHKTLLWRNREKNSLNFICIRCGMIYQFGQDTEVING